MTIEFWISSGILVISLSVVAFVIFRQVNITKKIALLESVIEDLNRQNHKLAKTIKERDSEDSVKKIVEESVENKIASLIHPLKEIKKIASEYREQQEIAAKQTIDYEQSVLGLYDEGKNENEIADILGLSVTQVELILTLNNPQ